LIEIQKTLLEEDGQIPNTLMSSEVEVWTRVKSIAEVSAYRIECKSLCLMKFKCRSVYNKALEFRNLVDMYNSDVVIETE
jgi:hypothetical protein